MDIYHIIIAIGVVDVIMGLYLVHKGEKLGYAVLYSSIFCIVSLIILYIMEIVEVVE